MWTGCRDRAWPPVPTPCGSSQLREDESYCDGHGILRPLVEIAHLLFLGARHPEFLRDGEYPAGTNFSRRTALEERTGGKLSAPALRRPTWSAMASYCQLQ